MSSPLLTIENLRYAWPGSTEPVLDLADFRLDRGEKLFLYGPSGSGKSTLLALIGGLVQPDQGRIEFDGIQLQDLSRRQRDRFRADHLGVIFQQFNLLPWLDVSANVVLPCRFSRTRTRHAGDMMTEARRLLKAMDLPPELWSRRADSLSVGQQQRVAAARALIGRPELILADEPTSALDSDRRGDFLELLFRQAAEADSTLLFVSHDRSLAGHFDRKLDLSQINQAGVLACP